MYEKHLIINILIDYQIHDNIMMIMNLSNENFDDELNFNSKLTPFMIDAGVG